MGERGASGPRVDLRRRGTRVPVTLARRSPRPQPRPSRETLASVVSVLRRVDAAPLGNVRVAPAVAMARLGPAAVGGQDLLNGYVRPPGVAPLPGVDLTMAVAGNLPGDNLEFLNAGH